MSFNAWPIRDVGDDNTGWVQGRIVGEPPLLAPLSKRPCFYYSLFTLEVGEQNERADELMIDDGTGRAIIVLAGAIMQVDYDHTVGDQREGILGPGELIAVHGHCRWERDPDPQRYGLYRDLLPQRLRVTRTQRVDLWVSEDVPERRR